MTAATPLRDIQKRYGTNAMALAICISLVFLIFGHKAVCRGMVMGALFSIINFVLMAQTVHSKVGRDRTGATLSALGNIIFRYLLMAIPLFVAIKLPRFDLLATIAGLFAVQVVILVDHVSRKLLISWRK